jgi:hypothetical protein
MPGRSRAQQPRGPLLRAPLALHVARRHSALHQRGEPRERRAWSVVA